MIAASLCTVGCNERWLINAAVKDGFLCMGKIGVSKPLLMSSLSNLLLRLRMFNLWSPILRVNFIFGSSLSKSLWNFSNVESQPHQMKKMSTYLDHRRICLEQIQCLNVQRSKQSINKSASKDENGPPTGRLPGNLKVCPLNWQRIFFSTHDNISFSNSSMVSRLSPALKRSSYVISIAFSTLILVNMAVM